MIFSLAIKILPPPPTPGQMLYVFLHIAPALNAGRMLGEEL